ncbi:hypothetical protein HK101_002506 [Irineochytrium annulatum]|nr:hypothetical protein HK101_002506 [Irineochytrium annulatum]
MGSSSPLPVTQPGVPSAPVYNVIRDATFNAFFPYAVLSGLAYCNDTVLTTSAGWSNCATCSALGVAQPIFMQGEIVRDGDWHAGIVTYDERKGEVVVAFRGTKTVDNFLLTDLNDITTIHNSGVSFESGFYSAWLSLRSQTLSAITTVTSTLCTTCTSITFTGHSLGGSMANIAAWEYTNNVTQQSALLPASLVTFGCPKTADAALQNTKLASSVSLANGDDVVPHYPFTNTFVQRPTLHYWPRPFLTSPIVSCDATLLLDDPACKSHAPSFQSISDHVHFGPYRVGLEFCANDYSGDVRAVKGG